MDSQTTVHTTVVFADLIGSTGLFEATGNASAARAVTQLTQWICEIFVSNDGHIVKTLGDGVLATFKESSNAVEAVIEMQRRHQKNLVSNRGNPQMPIRVGVASGNVEIVAGDCYGDAVNVAARLSDLSGASQIWAASSVLEGSGREGSVRYRPLGPINIRGRAEPCSVYQIEWKVEENSDFLTMQASIDSIPSGADGDVLGGEIALSWLEKVKTFKAFDLPVHVGRDKKVEFVVNDPRVSREHVRFEWRNGGVVLVDVSSYGSWVRFAGASSDLLLRRDECVLHGSGEIALGAPFTDLSVPTLTFSVS
jgi:adenylate cyclase